MWTLLFLLLATAAASDYEEEGIRCSTRITEACESDSGPPDFPGTEEELEDACKFALKYLECVNRTVKDCHEGEEELVHFREMSRVVNRVCVQDSLLYSAIAQSLPCLKKNGPTFLLCPSLNEEGMRTFSEILESTGITDVAAPDSEPEPCLRVLYRMGCFTSNIGKICGDVARHAVIDLVSEMDAPFENCRPGMKENIGQIARVMQLEAEKGEDVENEIKKRK